MWGHLQAAPPNLGHHPKNVTHPVFFPVKTVCADERQQQSQPAATMSDREMKMCPPAPLFRGFHLYNKTLQGSPNGAISKPSAGRTGRITSAHDGGEHSSDNAETKYSEGRKQRLGFWVNTSPGADASGEQASPSGHVRLLVS